MTRKKFLKIITQILLYPLLVIVYVSINRQIKFSEKKKILLPDVINKKITFLNEIIIVKDDDNLKVYSSKCTHLGCKIDSIEKNCFVCKCHGSKFSFDGRVIQGPANKNLIELKISRDSSHKYFVYE